MGSSAPNQPHLTLPVQGTTTVRADEARPAAVEDFPEGLENGSTGMTPAALNAAERTINITPNGQTVLVNATPISTGYILTVVSSTAETFNMTNASGLLTRSCIVAAGNGNTATNTGGGCRSGTW